MCNQNFAQVCLLLEKVRHDYKYALEYIHHVQNKSRKNMYLNNQEEKIHNKPALANTFWLILTCGGIPWYTERYACCCLSLSITFHHLELQCNDSSVSGLFKPNISKIAGFFECTDKSLYKYSSSIYMYVDLQHSQTRPLWTWRLWPPVVQIQWWQF